MVAVEGASRGSISLLVFIAVLGGDDGDGRMVLVV